MTLDIELERNLERAVSMVLGQSDGPGDQALRARRLVNVVVRACAKVCGPTVAAAEAFQIGRKVTDTRGRG